MGTLAWNHFLCGGFFGVFALFGPEKDVDRFVGGKASCRIDNYLVPLLFCKEAEVDFLIKRTKLLIHMLLLRRKMRNIFLRAISWCLKA